MAENVYMFGELNSDMALEVCERITCAEEDIDIYINSVGGCVEDAFAIISAIETTPHKVTVHALRECMSAALMVFVCADERVAYKHSRFMYHSIQYNSINLTGQYIEEDVKRFVRDQDAVDELFDQYTKLPEDIRNTSKRTGHDYFFEAEDAIRYGVADVIRSPKREQVG